MANSRFISNDELDQQAADALKAEQPEEHAMSSLAQHVREFWEQAKRAKLEIEQKMLAGFRQINGEYSPELQKALEAANLPTDFIRLTYHKCRDVESWLLNQLNPFGDRTWDVSTSTTVQIPPDIEEQIRRSAQTQVFQQAVAESEQSGQPISEEAVLQSAKEREEELRKFVKMKAKAFAEERSTNMERTILQQLHDGGWQRAFKACINDFSRMKACVIKGPIFRKEIVPAWKQGPDGYVPDTELKVTPLFERVNPFDWYPAPDSIGVDDGPAIELEHPTRKDLQNLIGVKGYKESVIREILQQMPKGHKENTAVAAERFILEKESNNGLYDGNKYDLINYWGEVPGHILQEWGMPGSAALDPDFDHQVNVKVIANHVIKASINPDPFGKKPYGVSSFVKSNDSQWGDSPPELMATVQGVCNLALRSLVHNVGISSGPLTEMDKDRLAPGETPEIWPHKVVLTTNRKMQEGPAVRYYQSPLLARDLMAIYDRFKREADDLVVPSYGSGNSLVGAAAKTAGGLAMMMNAANRNVEVAIDNVDTDIIIPMVERMFNFNMLYNPDPTIKGDLKVKARGSSHQTIKETRTVKLKEVLQQSNNPVDMAIIGAKGRAYQWAEVFKAIGIDVEQAMPNLEDLEKAHPAATVPVEGQAKQLPAPAEMDHSGNKAGGPQPGAQA